MSLIGFLEYEDTCNVVSRLYDYPALLLLCCNLTYSVGTPAALMVKPSPDVPGRNRIDGIFVSDEALNSSTTAVSTRESHFK